MSFIDGDWRDYERSNMPYVNGKKYSYTPAGKKAAAKARKKLKNNCSL